MTQLVLRDQPFLDAASRRDPRARRSGDAAGPAASRAPAIDLELVTTFAGFEALEPEWNALHGASAKPAQIFQGFNWCWHWCRHYLGTDGSGPSLAIVTGRISGRLALILPFVTRRTAGLTELCWLGEPVSQYGDGLARPEASDPETIEAAWRFAIAHTRADVANLRRVRADATVAPLMARLGARVTATEDAPMLDLAQDESFAAWEARRQPRARKNRKRQARKLAEQAPVSFVAFPHGEAAASMAGHAVRLKRETLDDKATVSPTLADERFERFFVDAAHGHGRPAGVTVLALVCGDAPAALKIMIESPQAAFLHLAVFEPRFGKCGAGALLLEHVVERCITDRRGMLDLLPPRHDYKLDFADATVTVDDYAIALSAKGWLYAQGFLRLRRRLKAMIEAAPKSVRRLIATLTRKQPRSAAAAASASDHSAA